MNLPEEIMSEIVEYNGRIYKLHIRESVFDTKHLMLQVGEIVLDQYTYIISFPIVGNGYVDKAYYKHWEKYLDLGDHLMARFRKLRAFL